MKRKQFSDEQIIAILKQQEGGYKTAEICHKMGISQSTFYNWKARYGGMSVGDVPRLRQLEAENAALRRVVANLDSAVLKEVLLKRL